MPKADVSEKPKPMNENKIRIRYLGLAKNIVGKREEEIGIPGDVTVRELLDSLAQRYGDNFRIQVTTREGGLCANVKVFVGGDDIDEIGGLDTMLDRQTEAVIMIIVPAIAGG